MPAAPPTARPEPSSPPCRCLTVTVSQRTVASVGRWYMIFVMASRYEIELEVEVRRWLESLSAADYLRVMKLADYLADHAETLGEPQTRHLGGQAA